LRAWWRNTGVASAAILALRRVSAKVLAGACALVVCAASPAPARSAAAPGCEAQATRAALASFVKAFSAGDSAALDSLFAQRPDFKWYSSNAPGLRRRLAAENRGSLLAYFSARHAKRDRLRLLRFTFTGVSPHGDGNFTFLMERSASDYHQGRRFQLVGKGAVTCSDDPAVAPVQFIVMSVGGPGSNTPK
jgi:hypothetical protein